MDKNRDFSLVVVFYKPEADAIRRFSRIGEKYHCVVIDNTPINYVYYQKPKNVEYISLTQNCGIARAQNIGIQQGISKGAEYLLFFDQDSEVTPSYIEKLVEAATILRERDPQIAAIGPVIVNKETNEEYKHGKLTDVFSPTQTIISSGSLIITETIKKVGLMEEELFIDLVDHEWCWRAKKNGYNIYTASNITLRHQVGITTVTIFGYPFISCSPIRYYYKTRNSIWLSKRDYIPFAWKIKNLFRLIVTFFFLYKINRQETKVCYHYLFHGIIDGFKKQENCNLS